MSTSKDGLSSDPARGWREIRNAEGALDFARAFLLLSKASRDYIHIHDPVPTDGASAPIDDGDLGLFYDVRELERSEVWRLVCALWEYIGDRVGEDYHRACGDGTGRTADPELYFGYSLPASYWADPRSDDQPEGYYDGQDETLAEGERLLHKRALAYGHAAEEAASNQRYALATLLRRKAGLAWTASAWGDRDHERTGSPWTLPQLLAVSGGKWREAARAYFRASLFQARASSDDEKGVTFEHEYAPNDQSIVEHERWPRQPVGGTDLGRFFGANDDIGRLEACWTSWAESRKSAYKKMGESRTALFAQLNVEARAKEGLCNNLGVLEDALRAAGRAREARQLFRRSRRADLASSRADIRARLAGVLVPCNPTGWPPEDVKPVATRSARLSAAASALPGGVALLLAYAYQFFTGTGRSAGRTLISFAGVFLVVSPLLFSAFAHLKNCSAKGCGGQVVHNFFACLRFSLGQALTVPPSDLSPTNTVGRWLAVLQTMVAAFALGYAVWVITKNSYGS